MSNYPGVLVDYQIDARIQDAHMLQPYPRKVGPASADVRLAPEGEMTLYACDGYQYTLELSAFSEKNPLWLWSGELLLAPMYERIRLPFDLSAHFFLRSTAARLGYDHALAMYVDPGYGMEHREGGVLTLEIKNNRPRFDYEMKRRFPESAIIRYEDYEERLPIYPMAPIGQLVFHRLSDLPHKSYQDVGRYRFQHSASAGAHHEL